MLLRLGCLPHVLVRRVVVGKFRRLRGDPTVYTIGVPGEADIQGVIGPNGRAFAVEVKTGDGRLNADQKKWRNRFESLGGIYILYRHPDDLLPLVA